MPLWVIPRHASASKTSLTELTSDSKAEATGLRGETDSKGQLPGPAIKEGSKVTRPHSHDSGMEEHRILLEIDFAGQDIISRYAIFVLLDYELSEGIRKETARTEETPRNHLHPSSYW